MRLLDTYALNIGAKIDRPFIYESYFPLPLEKYITFQPQTPYDSRNYSYWQDVIDIIEPILQTFGIYILQVGVAGDAPYQRVVNVQGQTSINQLAYIIKRSRLHFGPDSFGVHLASSFDVPIVGLYSISMPEVAGPHFGTPAKQKLFKGYERVGNKKPSYSNSESPKSINSIKPEEVANAIFELLGIDFRVPFETVFTGSRYCNQFVREIIPNTFNVMQSPEQPVEIRLDKHFNLEILAQQLTYWQKALLITDKSIPIELLKRFKNNIALIVYHITENDDPQFIKEAVALGIQVALTSRLPEEKLYPKKINYYEFGLINRIPEPPFAIIEKLRPDIDKLYYRSCKVIAANGAIYGSMADVEKDVKMSNTVEYRRVVDSPSFWQDLDFYTIIKKI